MITIQNMEHALMNPPGTVIYALERFSLKFDQHGDYRTKALTLGSYTRIEFLELEKVEGEIDVFKVVNHNNYADFKGLTSGRKYTIGNLYFDYHIGYNKRVIYKDWLQETTKILNNVENFMKTNHGKFKELWKQDADFSKMLEEFPEDFI